MSTKPDTRQIPDNILQPTIDEACKETQKTHFAIIGKTLVMTPTGYPETWPKEALARELLARLPEPTPPVVDGKTPAEVAFEAAGYIFKWESCQNKDRWHRVASAVLAAFGGNLEAAIARMEAVPWKELEQIWDNAPTIRQNNEATLANAFVAVRARLIAAARDGQGEVVDWKAKADRLEHERNGYKQESGDWQARAEKAEAELARVRHLYDSRIAELEETKECVVSDLEDSKPATETFEAYGKVWRHHTPGDPMPCEANAKIYVILNDEPESAGDPPIRGDQIEWDNQGAGDIIGWRYADTTPALAPPPEPWQPDVGDTVKLKSGGPVMTVLDNNGLCYCTWSVEGEMYSNSFPAACLTPAKEAQP